MQMQIKWLIDRRNVPALHQVERLLGNDDLCQLFRDAIRLGRESTLEEFDKDTPKFQRGQAAYLKICNFLRKAMARTNWIEEHPENQQCFIHASDDEDLPARVTYFAGHLDEGKKFFRINPKGKLTKISLAANREQTSFLDEAGFENEELAAQHLSELTLFLMSCWDWSQQPDESWRIRIRSWLAFCDSALDRKGRPMEDEDESRFTRATIIAYRELDDYFYESASPKNVGPEPVVSTPVVIELSSLEDEFGK